MIALVAFIIALLLAVDAIEPEGAWLVTLTVLFGIQAFRPRGWLPQPMAAFPFTAFIIALLLTIGAVEATAAWLVTLAVLAGVDAFGPGRRRWRFRPRSARWERRRAWAGGWSDDW
jgi:hypothetical protein